MFVKAAAGLQCPKENNPRDYVTDGEAVEVERSSYYQRLIDDGSLVEVPTPRVKKDLQGGV